MRTMWQEQAILLFFKYLFLTERERESERTSTHASGQVGADRSRLHAVSTEPDVGLELMNREVMT